MNHRTVSGISLSLLLVVAAACGGAQPVKSPENQNQEIEEPAGDEPSGQSDVARIVDATCNDLLYATTQADAARTLSYAMQLAEAVGLSNAQLGSLLQAECGSLISAAQLLP
jgi:hypothetical protein